jgi:hypothetical protein
MTVHYRIHKSPQSFPRQIYFNKQPINKLVPISVIVTASEWRCRKTDRKEGEERKVLKLKLYIKIAHDIPIFMFRFQPNIFH